MRISAKHHQVLVGMALPGCGIESVGILKVERNLSAAVDRSIGKFKYAPSWLKRVNAVPLDPAHMPLSDREFRFARFGGLPGAIRDASADNWGRLLIERYHQSRGLREPLSELNYLLCSPSDRAGNLHFATNFDSSGEPKWDEHALKPQALKELGLLRDYVIAVFKAKGSDPSAYYPKELDSLLTGLGGARPKISVTTPNGLVMLKMANPQLDHSPNAKLEAASVAMAGLCGIETVKAKLLKVGGGDEMLGIQRFDESAPGVRKQMVSAMTILNAVDDPYGRNNWSYPLFAQELNRWSSQPSKDKEQLFRSMVLRAMISDSDDHPRNYAMVRDVNVGSGCTFGQWRLAPFFDSVVGLGRGHKACDLAMTIGTLGSSISQENLCSQSAAFGLTHEQALNITKEIEIKVLNHFPALLDRFGVSASDKQQALQGVSPLNDRPQDSALDRLMGNFQLQHDERDAIKASVSSRSTNRPGV